VRNYDDLLAQRRRPVVGYRRELMKDGIFELPLNLKRSHFSYAHTDEDVDRPARGDRGRGDAIPGLPRVTDSPVGCTIDFSRAGKQVGHLSLPKITNTAGWASTFVHVAQVANGDGPTVLVLAGNHGDEYEGQVAALRLLQELQPEQVSGRVIVIPVLSPAASKRTRATGPRAPTSTGRSRGGPTARRTSSSPTTSRASSSRWRTS
jgi:hypothetical protein